MFRSRTWFGGTKPRNPHSLDHLKYLYGLMSKNQIVSESNRSLLVETLRSISEILIWGDQNDSSVFDFFLEKNMLSFFLKIMKQKCGSFVCVQLLQTLNILFENIRNETSLYYLLSNNHVNSIIVHKFDFSDEEVMAYYISFLKTLSFKLNIHTIHFFYNEHTNDFPLYTEAIKFFNHSESMVRIAVRTLTLNVYKVHDESMLRFIRDKTAAPYFSNLVWFIGNHIIELDQCVRADADHSSRGKLSDLVAEHLDHIHYINDILCLEIEHLNDVLVEQLLQRLLQPIYVQSLIKGEVSCGDRPTVSRVVALFLLSQIFLIFHHEPLVAKLTGLLFETRVGSTEPVDQNGHNITDEEKEMRLERQASVSLHLESILEVFVVMENDYQALFALTLFNAISQNKGVNGDRRYWKSSPFRSMVIGKCTQLLSVACQPTSKVRTVTIELAALLLLRLTLDPETSKHDLDDKDLALLEQAKEESIMVCRTSYKTEDMFLELFETEVSELNKRPLQVEYLLQDSSVLLPPTGTPMTGIDFNKRLPCGEVERARRAIRVFLLMRNLSHKIRGEEESSLPLIREQQCVKVSDVLDLNNADLIACTVVHRDSSKTRRFLVIDPVQLILVEPDARRLGWGVAKFVGFLQDVEVSGDKEDSRCLHVTVHDSPTAASFTAKSLSPAHRPPLLAAKFVFDDHIRCMAAKQRLTKGRLKARQRKMLLIGRLLDVATPTSSSPPLGSLQVLRQEMAASNLRRNLLTRTGVIGIGAAVPFQPLPVFPGSSPIRPATTLRFPGVAVTSSGASAVRHRSSSAHAPLTRTDAPDSIPLNELSISQKDTNEKEKDSALGD